MRDKVVIRTKIKLMNYLGEMVASILGMASDDCGKAPRLKGTVCIDIPRSLRVHPQATMGSGLVDQLYGLSLGSAMKVVVSRWDGCYRSKGNSSERPCLDLPVVIHHAV